MTVDVVQEACKNYKPVIGRTYSVTDAQKVWDGLGLWIENYLCKRKGVIVPGLGTFTLSEWALDTGLGKPLIICHPVFFLSENLVRSFHIRQREVYVSNSIPCHLIHYGGVATLACLDRTMVQSCVHEVTQALRRLLWQRTDLRLKLRGVGELTVRNSHAHLEVCAQLEGKVRGMVNIRRRHAVERPVHPWSPHRILP